MNSASQILIEKAEAGRVLSRAEAEEFMEQLLSGRIATPEIVRMLLALNQRAVSVKELAGFARIMRKHAAPVFAADEPRPTGLVDTCGTGGDASGTFNISTATAFVVAGAGVRVAKHGNRSVTSKCGSADVMEALGVNINLPPARIAACLEQVGIAFLFAPAMHSAMKHVQTARRELHLRTVFNLLGPLTNPARATCQVVGVYSADLVEKLAEALSMLGLRRALVVHGSDGLDEITITASTRIAEVRDGQVHSYEVTPEEFGLQRATLEEISGGDASHNAGLIREVLAGKRSARRDIVLLNAAAALVAAERADHLRDAVPLAAKAIDSGAALAKLQALIAFTTAHTQRPH